PAPPTSPANSRSIATMSMAIPIPPCSRATGTTPTQRMRASSATGGSAAYRPGSTGTATSGTWAPARPLYNPLELLTTLHGISMAIYEFDGLAPIIDKDTFIFDSADIIGHVVLEAGVSVWSNASIRGDNAVIKIGRNSNVQENSVLHVDTGVPLTVVANVTIGHQAMLHGCTIEDGALIGIQAIVLNNAHIGRNRLIGAGALIPVGRQILDNSLVV